MTILYKSLVRSLLEYCCPLWSPTKVTEIQLIVGVQRTFTSHIILAVLSISTIIGNDSYSLNGCLYSADGRGISSWWCGRFSIMWYQTAVISSSRWLQDTVIIPSLSKSSSLRNQSLYNRSFTVQGPKLWNKVPPTAVEADISFDMFRCCLATGTAAVGQTQWLTTRHPGGQIFDDPSGSTDELNEVSLARRKIF